MLTQGKERPERRVLAVNEGGSGRRVALELSCGELLDVHRFSIREAMSSLFMARVIARSPDPRLHLCDIAGRPATLRLVSGTRHALRERRWAGICGRIHRLRPVALREGEAGLSTYELLIVPRLWWLTKGRHHRIFQRQSIPEIVRGLLEEWAIPATWHIDEAEHPRLAYRVQYGESDLAFISRLLEEAGISYAFAEGEGEGEDARVVLSDAPEQTGARREQALGYLDDASAAGERAFVTGVGVAEEPRVEGVTLRDHDFLRPAWALLGEARAGRPEGGRPGRGSERFEYRPGAFVVERDGSGASHDAAHGARLATRALEAELTGHCAIGFEANVLDLAPGTVFAMEGYEGYPCAELDPRIGLLVTELSIEGSPNGAWTICGAAVPASEPYRPAQVTPRPRAHGVQCAVVVGPRGQEIHVDEHGRVRVQFPWDREGELDERSSCWVRVSQGWAGAGLGMFALPRVGQEVIVAFEEGNPDRPLIVGRVANALNPLPLKLPQEQTQSVWRSASSPGGEGYNEIRFEDRKGSEFMAMRAERDRRTSVGLDDALAVGRHRAKVVGGDETARTEGQLVMYVGQDGHLTFGGELRERVGGMRSLTVEGDQHTEVGGDAALEAGRAVHIRAGTTLVLEGGDVTLRGAGGFIRIDASGVTINGATVRIQEGGAPGEGRGAHPELPRVPPGVTPQRAPRRLPLFEFPGVPKGRWPGRGEPLNEDEMFLCVLMCQCVDAPLPQRCVEKKLLEMDRLAGGLSPYKPEVRYDMSKDPPEPIMSRNDPSRPTTGNPKGNKHPDVTVLHDPSRLLSRDNIKEIVEMKFGRDTLSNEQLQDYDVIAGGVRFRVLSPDDCGCPDGEKEPAPEPVPMTTAEIVEVVALSLALLWMLVNDAAPGGQLDDVLIPAAIRRLAPSVARLLVRLLSRLPPLAPPLPVP